MQDSAAEAARAGGGGVGLEDNRKTLCCPFDATLTLPNLDSGSLLPALMLSKILDGSQPPAKGQEEKEEEA